MTPVPKKEKKKKNKKAKKNKRNHSVIQEEEEASVPGAIPESNEEEYEVDEEGYRIVPDHRPATRFGDSSSSSGSSDSSDSEDEGTLWGDATGAFLLNQR